MMIGVPVDTDLGVAGGDGAYEWTLIDGELPDGLDLDTESGRITGTPNSPETSEAVIRVRSGDGQQTIGTFRFQVIGGLVISTPSLPTGVVGVGVNLNLEAMGGSGSYSWAVAAGALPAGLGLSANGRITGIPGAVQGATFTVEVTSADGQSARRDFTMSIYALLEFVGSGTTPVVVGTSFSTPLNAFGGDGDYHWTIVGDVPAGVSLGYLSGILSALHLP